MKRKAVDHLIKCFRVSQRESCKMVGLNRSTYQYEAQPGNQISEFYGYPKRIRVDNGPEFRCKEFSLWAQEKNIKIEYTRPGTPTDNAMIESFNGKFRDECLNQTIFRNIKKARTIIENWRVYYNNIRPHSTLGYCTPKEYLKKLEKLALKVA